MGYSAYQQSQLAEIMEATPEKLVQILYGIAIQSLGSAIQALRDADVPERVHHINKTIAVLVELSNALDFDHGREIAKTYSEIYAYCRRRLVEANTTMDSSILEEVRNHISALNEALRIGNSWANPMPYIEAPFIAMTKADIARRGAALGVDFAHTWSCYKGGEIHCGACGTCVERIEAFKLAGFDDPTMYDPEGLKKYKAMKEKGLVEVQA